MKDKGFGSNQGTIGQTGLNTHGDMNTPLQARLKQLLTRISDFVSSNRIQLATILSQFERGLSTGTIPQIAFIQALEQVQVPIANEEKYFVAENYMVHSSQVTVGQQQGQVDYRKFLEDIKLYASPSAQAKGVQSLTKEQSDFFKNLASHLKSNGKSAGLADGVGELGGLQRGYLSRPSLEELFKRNGYTFNPKQFSVMFSALDTNTSGTEYNIKQLFELLFGA